MKDSLDSWMSTRPDDDLKRQKIKIGKAGERRGKRGRGGKGNWKGRKGAGEGGKKGPAARADVAGPNPGKRANP